MRASVVIALVLSAPFWAIGAFLTPFLQDEPRGWVEKAWWWLLVAHFVPLTCHFGAQARCAAKVPESHGGDLATKGCLLNVLSVLLSSIAQMPDGVLAFAILLVALNIAASAYWLTSLVRLGKRLRDHALAEAARAYRVWFPFGVVLLVTFLTGALLAQRAGSVPMVRAGWTGAGLIVFFLLWQYAAVLRLAVSAIDRRAPLAD